MPVRKIPKSYRAVTGRFPSVVNGRCVGYESRLERDYFLRLEFDREVEAYEEQPLQIPGRVNGRDVLYTLDCLVTFKTDRRQLLVEVKSQEDLEAKDEKIELKVARAQEYAADNGMDFQVISENEIYDQALENYRRLYRFAKPPAKFNERRERILAELQTHDVLSMGQLLQSLSDQRLVQADFQTTIWHMIFTGEIETDLSAPLNYDSEMRVAHG